MKIQIIDVGNTHTKFADFEVSDKGMVDLKEFHRVVSPREDPQDLLDVVRKNVRMQSDVLMINAFSDSFVYDGQWYFADADVPPYVDKHLVCDTAHEMKYENTGQNNSLGLVGVPALLQSVKTKSDYPPETPQGWLLRKLFDVKPHWELTHASRSGVYHLTRRGWCYLPEDLNNLPATRQLLRCPVYQTGKTVDMISSVRILAGGLDHSFVSSYKSGAYVASGTWCNIIQAEPCFLPTQAQEKAGIRWGILADGRYAKEINFPVDTADATTFETVKEALPLMNLTASMPLTGGSASKVRPLIEAEAKLFYDLKGGFPHLEMSAAAYFAWRCSFVS